MRCPQALIYFVYIYIKFNDAVASMGQTETLVSVTFSSWGKSFTNFARSGIYRNVVRSIYPETSLYIKISLLILPRVIIYIL